ncbi:hypothetical protein AB5I41_31815 [Sphingomonas sp. MMS24-JH45]
MLVMHRRRRRGERAERRARLYQPDRLGRAQGQRERRRGDRRPRRASAAFRGLRDARVFALNPPRCAG